MMILGTRGKGVERDIDVAQDQLRPSIRSSVLALSLTAMPTKRPAAAWHSGRDGKSRYGCFAAATELKADLLRDEDGAPIPASHIPSGLPTSIRWF